MSAFVAMCSICLEENSEGIHELECGHSFHSSCLITWLRRGNLSCPNCRDDLHLQSEIPTFSLMERSKFICNTFGRRRNPPPMLCRMMTRLKRAKERESNAQKAYRDFMKENRECVRQIHLLSAANRRTRRQVIDAKRLIGLFDSPELVLPALRVAGSHYS